MVRIRSRTSLAIVWTAGRALLAQLPPVVAKTLALPGNDGTRLHECQSALPARPKQRQPHPEQTIGWTEAWTMHCVLIDRELMPQREVFQVQCGSRPEETCNTGD
jgi:hypothetical protein